MTIAQQIAAEAKQEGKLEGRLEGIQEGKLEGVRQGILAVLIRQLEREFKVLPNNYRQCLTEADAETLLQWGERMIDAKTLDEVFNDVTT